MRDLEGRLVTVFGGSGFLGRYVVQRLARRGARIRVAVRRPENAQFLKPLGSVGQIRIMAANVRLPASLAPAIEGADAVVNLAGILAPSGKQSFEAVQAAGAAAVARTAKHAGIDRLVHVSAIGADPDSLSAYARTKAAGEAAVREAVKPATVLRPSVVFGPEDDFFNRFAAMMRLAPVMPLVAGGTRFQPVYVGDVADAVLTALGSGGEAGGRTFELGGPGIYSMREIYELIMKETMIRRPVVDVPIWLARFMAAFLQFLPKPPLTPDQLKLLARDTVVADDAEGLEALGVAPTPVEVVLPTYLRRYRPEGQFSRPRAAG